LNRPIVFGAYDVETSETGPVLFNTLFAITPRYDRPGSQGTVERYRKYRLLPFAETIPGLSQQEWFRRSLPNIGFFGQGAGPTTFTIETPSRKKLRLGPVICSESLSSTHVVETAKLGAEVLLNVGSDGWFGDWGEPQFHLAVAKLRSVETRRPQIRSANTGISALILPTGEVAARSDIGAETVLSIDVPISSAEDSLVMRWGSWFGPTALVLGLFVLLLLVRGSRSAHEDGV
jgi:apolipoprotein N-acyltransferase